MSASSVYDESKGLVSVGFVSGISLGITRKQFLKLLPLLGSRLVAWIFENRPLAGLSSCVCLFRWLGGGSRFNLYVLFLRWLTYLLDPQCFSISLYFSHGVRDLLSCSSRTIFRFFKLPMYIEFSKWYNLLIWESKTVNLRQSLNSPTVIALICGFIRFPLSNKVRSSDNKWIIFVLQLPFRSS